MCFYENYLKELLPKPLLDACVVDFRSKMNTVADFL